MTQPELTNTGNSVISGVDSYFHDDDSADSTVNDAMTGITSIALGVIAPGPSSLAFVHS